MVIVAVNDDDQARAGRQRADATKGGVAIMETIYAAFFNNYFVSLFYFIFFFFFAVFSFL